MVRVGANLIVERGFLDGVGVGVVPEGVVGEECGVVVRTVERGSVGESGAEERKLGVVERVVAMNTRERIESTRTVGELVSVIASETLDVSSGPAPVRNQVGSRTLGLTP